MIVIVILTFLIILILLLKIRSFNLALILLGIIGIGSIIPWFDNKISLINNNECVIGKEKKINGIIFEGCLDKVQFFFTQLYMKNSL